MASIADDILAQRAKEGAVMSTDTDTSRMYVDSEQTAGYAHGRMRYGPEVFQYIADYCRETRPDLDLCVDVGCGSGQATVGFANFFKRVIGADISEVQISHAPTDIPNVEFKVTSAEQLPFLESGSVDLWSSAESFNYMPEKETFAEADRVLRPGGTLVIFGYRGLASSVRQIQDVLMKYIYKILPYWPEETKATFDGFKDVILPYPGWTRNDDLKVTHRMTFDQFIGLWRSFYSVVTYQKMHPAEDLMGDIETSFREAHHQAFGPTKEMIFEISYDIFILIGRKPLK